MRTSCLAAALLAAAATTARADGAATITLTADGQAFAADLGLDPAQLEQRIEAELAALYDTANVDGFLRSFANATSFASRGTGVDYAPLFRSAELGATVNLAAAVDGLEPGKDPAAGVAANLALMGGLSLARWGHPRITLYAHGFHRGASLDQLSGTISTGGVHAQFHVLAPLAPPSGAGLLLQWSGLHLTTGVELARWRFHADHPIERSFTIADAAGADVGLDGAGVGTFDLAATSTAIPVELTTSVRVAYFASAYVGGGAELQLGSADTEIALDGAVTGQRPDGTTVDVGTATITATGSAAPSKVAYHLLAGVEANLGPVKAVVQGTFVPFDGASVGLGLRVRL